MAVEYVDNNYVCTGNIGANINGWTNKGCEGNVNAGGTCTSHNRYVSSDALGSTGISAPTAGSIATAAKVNEVLTAVRDELNRSARTDANGNVILLVNSNESITASTLNTAIAHLNDLYSGASLRIYSGNLITASNVETIINYVNASRQKCVCNCNYSCTCNCNYGCTCYCNYSDKRLKTNIEKIGVQNGFNIYTYNYIWDKTTKHTGVMAQEVLKTSYKHAIKMDKNGYYMVNYSALPITIKGKK